MRRLLTRSQFIKPRFLLLIFLVMAGIMISSALIELRQSRKELLELMERQAHTLLETVILASNNTVRTNILIEELIEERLINNAHFIKRMYEEGRVSNSVLQKFARENHLFRVNIFKSNGIKIYSSHVPAHDHPDSHEKSEKILNPIFQAELDTLFIGLKTARYEKGYRFAVAVAARDRSAIVVNLDAAQLLEFRKQIGFGSLLRSLIENPGIDYVALQDTAGILAASGNIKDLERIKSSEFLNRAIENNVMDVRIVEFQGEDVFEAVHPFVYEGESVGLFRIGLSLSPLQAINQRIYRRISFISIILLVIGFILFTLLIIRQNLDVAKKQYQVVETYSRNIIQNVSDAIIVCEGAGEIKIFNQSASKLFGIEPGMVLGKNVKSISKEIDWDTFFREQISMQEITLQIRDHVKYILVSQSQYLNADDIITRILVFRDLTDQKRLQSQIQRRERLTALGQLASGVAHEIRNPLNAIGMIIQQLDRDFKPLSQEDDYHQLMGMVYQEVKRINQTIENFLKFARPEELNPEVFSLNDFLSDLRREYKALLTESGIQMELDLNWSGEVKWDSGKIRQILRNLIQNSIDAMGDGGRITIQVSQAEEQFLELRVSDNGPGISPEIQRKIFNLYFTTKATGTGIGLSIIQQIVDQHEGSISFDSISGKGTNFLIILPVQVGLKEKDSDT